MSDSFPTVASVQARLRVELSRLCIAGFPVTAKLVVCSAEDFDVKLYEGEQLIKASGNEPMAFYVIRANSDNRVNALMLIEQAKVYAKERL